MALSTVLYVARDKARTDRNERQSKVLILSNICVHIYVLVTRWSHVIENGLCRNIRLPCIFLTCPSFPFLSLPSLTSTVSDIIFKCSWLHWLSSFKFSCYQWRMDFIWHDDGEEIFWHSFTRLPTAFNPKHVDKMNSFLQCPLSSWLLAVFENLKLEKVKLKNYFFLARLRLFIDFSTFSAPFQ